MDETKPNEEKFIPIEVIGTIEEIDENLEIKNDNTSDGLSVIPIEVIGTIDEIEEDDFPVTSLYGELKIPRDAINGTAS